MVLRSMPVPAWLGPVAPDGDVVVSSRFRFARNLRGLPFPHHCTADQARLAARAVTDAGREAGLSPHGPVTRAERDFLLGCRLVSADFDPAAPGRAVLLDPRRAISAMVNEEDHLRLQALVAGWDPDGARRTAEACLSALEQRLRFMHAQPWGYLTASPYNCGEAARWSALFHLIGLARQRSLQPMLKALASSGLTARGLFGESSRAVGAFFQVSTVRLGRNEFVGACELLIRQEREARRAVSTDELAARLADAVATAQASSEMSLREALRIFAWARWAASAAVPGAPESAREVDLWVSTMEVFGTQDPATAARQRADYVRHRLEGSWRAIRNLHAGATHNLS